MTEQPTQDKPRRRLEYPGQSRTRTILIVTGILAAVIVFAVSAATKDDKTPATGRKMSPTEAACDMLRKGDTPQFTYDVMVDLLEQHSFEFPNPEVSARAAVQAAQDQGC